MGRMDTTLDLRLFDGGAGEAASGGADAATQAAAPAGKPTKAQLRQVVYGAEAREQAPGQARGAAGGPGASGEAGAESFDELIRGKYKAEYDKRVQEQLARRFRQHEQLQARQARLEPMLEILAGKYGVDARNVDALAKAVESDEALYEAEANEQGIPLEQYRRMKQIERENNRFKAVVEDAQRRQNAERIYGEWMRQVESAKAVYPGLRFEAELGNPDFLRLLRAGVDVRAAYEVVHRDEIIGGAMQFTAQKVAGKVASDVRARGARPQENGAGAQSPSVMRKTHAGELTRDDVLEIARRAKKGIRTSFG